MIDEHATICPHCQQPTGFDAPIPEPVVMPEPEPVMPEPEPIPEPIPEPAPTPQPQIVPPPIPPAPKPAPQQPAPQQPAPQQAPPQQPAYQQVPPQQPPYQPAPPQQPPYQPAPPQQPPYQQPAPEPAQPKKKSKAWLWILLVLLLLGGGGTAVYFFVLDQDLNNISKIFGNKTEQVDDFDDEDMDEESDADLTDSEEETDLSELGIDDTDVDAVSEMSLLDVLNEKAADVVKNHGKVVCKLVNEENPFLLFVRDTRLYQFKAKSQETTEVNFEKLNGKARVLYGGTQNGIRSWVYDDAAKTMTLKVQTYAADGKSAGIGEYKLNVETMTLRVVDEGKVTQTQPQPQKQKPQTTPQREPEPEPQNHGTGFHLERI